MESKEQDTSYRCESDEMGRTDEQAEPTRQQACHSWSADLGSTTASNPPAAKDGKELAGLRPVVPASTGVEDLWTARQ